MMTSKLGDASRIYNGGSSSSLLQHPARLRIEVTGTCCDEFTLARIVEQPGIAHGRCHGVRVGLMWPMTNVAVSRFMMRFSTVGG